MNRPQYCKKRDGNAARLMEVCALLVLYLFVATPLAPLIVAAVGSLDPSHHVLIAQSLSGTQVVLRHENCRWVEHRHGLVARVLICFSKPSLPCNPDHVVQFGTVESIGEKPELDDCGTPEVPDAALSLAPTSFLPLLSPGRAAAAFARPPPFESLGILITRSTIFLI